MAFAHIARFPSARKSPSAAKRRADAIVARKLPLERPKLCPTRHLTLDQYVRLLACVEEGRDTATLDEISRALPQVPQPISAVLDLCEAGVLSADWAAAFDGDMRVRRVDRCS